ncbi:MAG: DMT family transporter [Marinoscillum sp.]
MNPQIVRHLALLAVGLLYGANYSILKSVTPKYIEPFGFIVIRVAVGTILFWLVGLFNKQPIDWRKDGKQVVLCAFFGVGINMLFFFKGMSLTSAINGSIIMTITPIAVLIISLFILKEKITHLKVIGLAMGLVGALLIIYQPDISLSQGDWRGDILIFLNALSYGTYLVLVKPLLIKYSPLTLAKWIFTIGFFIVLPVGWGEFHTIEWATLPISAYWAMAYVVIGVTVLVYLVNIWAMKKVNPSTVGAYIYVQPVFATFIASIFYGEILTLKHLLAAALVFIGVWLVTKRTKG